MSVMRINEPVRAQRQFEQDYRSGALQSFLERSPVRKDKSGDVAQAIATLTAGPLWMTFAPDAEVWHGDEIAPLGPDPVAYTREGAIALVCTLCDWLDAKGYPVCVAVWDSTESYAVKFRPGDRAWVPVTRGRGGRVQ